MELFWILPPSIPHCEGTSLPLETSRSQPRPRMTTVIPCLRMLKVHKVPGLLGWCQWSYMELPKIDGFPDFASWVTVGLEFGSSNLQHFGICCQFSGRLSCSVTANYCQLLGLWWFVWLSDYLWSACSSTYERYTDLHYQNLYSCPTVRLHYIFTADRYVKKVKLVMIFSGSGSIFILGPDGILEVLHLLTHTSGIGYGQSLRPTHW